MAEVIRQRKATIAEIRGLLMAGRIIPDRRSLKSDGQSEDPESLSCYTAGRFGKQMNTKLRSRESKISLREHDRNDPPEKRRLVLSKRRKSSLRLT